VNGHTREESWGCGLRETGSFIIGEVSNGGARHGEASILAVPTNGVLAARRAPMAILERQQV
jgi:hypothetical protein